MKLYLDEKFTNEEMKLIRITDSLEIGDFNGYTHKMRLFATLNDSYYPPFSQSYIENKIDVKDLLNIVKEHPDCFETINQYEYGHMIKVFYAVFKRKIPETDLSSFVIFNNKNVVLELIIQDGPYFGIFNVSLAISPYISILSAIDILIQEEEIQPFKFIQKEYEDEKEDEYHYVIKLYNEFGQEKEFAYPSLDSIKDRITSIRIIRKE